MSTRPVTTSPCRHRRAPTCLVILGCVVAAAACSDRVGPVGAVEVSPASVDLAYAQCATVTLTWRPSAPLPRQRGQATVFVHLLDSGGEIVRTFDHPLPQEWKVGRTVTYPLDLCQSAFGPPMVTGPYDLSLGLVDGSTGRRWELQASSSRQPKRHEYVLGTVKVPPSLVSPALDFGAGWMVEDPGRDRQVLMRRKLVGPGSISVQGLPGRGLLRLALVVTPAGAVRSAATVTLTSPSGATGPQNVPAGRQVVELPCEAGSVGVELRPPLLVSTPATDAAPWLALENLAWKPAPPPRP